MVGVPHPKQWSEDLWVQMEGHIVSNGLVALEDSVVCPPPEEDAQLLEGIPPLVDISKVAKGDDEGYLEALHAGMARLVALENRFVLPFVYLHQLVLVLRVATPSIAYNYVMSLYCTAILKSLQIES